MDQQINQKLTFVPRPAVHLGTFEGIHRRSSAGYHAPGSALKDWASLLAALSFSAATGIILAVTFMPELPQ